MNRRIIICERSGACPGFEGWTGLDAAERVSKVGSAHDVTLPVAESLITRSIALFGYSFSSWGIGAHFSNNQVQHSCPMVLWVVPGIPVLHWVARIEQIDKRGIPPSGSLRLVTNPNQPGAMQGGLSALADSAHVNLNDLGLPDKFGGWTVGGQLGLSMPVEGMLGFRIQAIAQNVRVLWSAVSQAYPE